MTTNIAFFRYTVHVVLEERTFIIGTDEWSLPKEAVRIYVQFSTGHSSPQTGGSWFGGRGSV